MPITSFKAFRIGFALYISGYWLSSLVFSKEIFHFLNINGTNPSNFWNFLYTNHLLVPYLSLLVLAPFGLIFLKTTRICALFLVANLISIYQFLPTFHGPPSGPYVGWILLWFIAYPKSEKLEKPHLLSWWFLLTLGYFCSGLAKALSPIWMQGEAVNALAKAGISQLWVENIVNYPMISKTLNYATLFFEMGSILFIFSYWGRKLIWFAFLGMHLFIIMGMNIPDIALFFLILNLALYEEPEVKYENK